MELIKHICRIQNTVFSMTFSIFCKMKMGLTNTNLSIQINTNQLLIQIQIIQINNNNNTNQLWTTMIYGFLFNVNQNY